MARRLTLVAPSLAVGGAERVIAFMANYWASRGEAVSVVTLSATDGDTYSLDGRVTRIALRLMRDAHGPIGAITNNIIRIRRVREAIARSAPDTVISFTDRMNVVTLLACRPIGVDTVISERIDPSRYDIGRAWSWLRRRVYPSARALVVQTDRVRRQMTGVMRGRPIYVIPNAVEAPPVSDTGSALHDSGNLHWIVALGRLAPQKGFDLLIEAFSRIAARHPRWSLKIFGEGPERRNLERLIQGRNLAGRVLLPGWEPHPIIELQQAELFILSSRFEGFPNALLEAMACGLPVISFDCDCGPREIISAETNGLLVPPEDISALAEAIDRTIADPQLRSRLGADAVRVVERFSIARYFSLWDAVLEKELPTSREVL